MKKFIFKYRVIIILCCIFFTLVSCVSQRNKNTNTATSNTKRTETRGTTNTNTATNSRNNTKENTQNTNDIDKNISRLAEQAVNKKTSKQTKKNNNDPFEKRKDLLKNINKESDRFVDTTYYMLKMENGQTEVANENINIAGGNTQEFYENLIRSFINATNEIEKSSSFDCSVFKVYANQFIFNDSLRQEAEFYYAECCISNDNLSMAIATLEELCKEKMNKGVAPKVLVRLGQVYCVLGEKSNAEKYFKKLKKEFPKSVYNQLADCDRL